MKLISVFKFNLQLDFKSRKTLKCLLSAGFGLFIATFTHILQANAIQSVEEIRQAAKKFLEEKQHSADKDNITITVGNIDSRLRLAKCEDALDFFLPQSGRRTGKTTVGVRCNTPTSWKIYVSAEIVRFQEVWIVTRSISRDEIITKADVEKRKMRVKNSRNIPMQSFKQLINASPKKNLRAGSIIYQDSLCLVCRGDKVSVSANNAYLSINVEGIALNDATLGESVQVRNSSSKKVFGATVTGKSQLSVNLIGMN